MSGRLFGRLHRDANQLAGRAFRGAVEFKGELWSKILYRPPIIAHHNRWSDDDAIDVVIATGGTGVTGRDVTPEAFHAVYEKEIPGFGEIFRMISWDKIRTSTIQSRTTAGVARGTYLFALPGSPGACRDGWDEILRLQLDIRYRPCNFVELMPRLRE